jgi:hypothetical protein
VLASDLGFLALGGIVGLLAGAALIAVLRTRPPSPRRIRLTVTPGSVPIRPSRTTLAGDPFARDPRWVALGDPVDAARTGPGGAAGGIGWATRNGTPVRSPAPHDSSPIAPEVDTVAETRAVHVETEPVGLEIAAGTDPVFAAIAAARGSALAESGMGAPVLLGRPGSPVPLLMTEAGSGVAILEAAIRARRSAANGSADGTASPGGGVPGGVRGGVLVLARADDGGPTDGHAAAQEPARGSSGGGDGEHVDGPDEAAPTGEGDPAAAAADPCSEARTTVDERCALAERMRLTAEHAGDALRQAQEALDEHVAQAAAAEAIADTRAQRAAKDEAQSTFRSEHARAGSRESVEQAARDWLQEINRINAAAREAAATLAREREAAGTLQISIERLTIEADAARVQAEGAEQSCVLARSALATCEEEVREVEGAGKVGSGDGAPDSGGGSAGDTPVPAPSTARTRGSNAASSAPEPAPVAEEGALSAAIRAGGHPAILGLLTGDRAVMQRLVSELAGENPVDQRRWQVQLADLVDAIVSRAIETCAFVFPDEHPFWSPFTRGQSVDIALALSSLGFRFDGLGGFADDRVPTQRDVSLALGYAGLDPMRVRRWPAETELAELYAEVTVAADEYILGAAPGLTLGELVGILGRRADALTEVWNAWGRISPILLEDIGT